MIRILNAIFPFADFMYILQLEDYNRARFLKWLPWFFLRRNFQVRDHLSYTQRVKLTLALAVLIWLLGLILIVLISARISLWSLLAIPVWLLLVPIAVLAANVIGELYYGRIKAGLRAQARLKVAAIPDLKVIAIAGSFGKTTTKNFIYQLVQYNYRTQMIPGNINTPAGIAVWIKNNLEAATQLLIMEVDAYYPGEIAKSCQIAPPDIAVLTNIGDQHLERLKTLQNLTTALADVFIHSKSNAHLIADADTWEQLQSLNLASQRQVVVKPSTPLHYQRQALNITDLSASNQINLTFALQVAAILDIPLNFVQDTLNNLELPDRRQKLTELFGYSAIDDSYNVSFTTAQAGINAAQKLAHDQHKKLLVITAGIPELGPQDQDKNLKLGQILSNQADHTIVLQSMLAKDVIAGFDTIESFTMVPKLSEFIPSLQTSYPAADWFLLLQPELNDLYY